MRSSDGGPPTVMVVEDIGWIRAGMKKILRGYGYLVIEAADDAEAVELGQRTPADLILTEEQLPTFGALIRRVREHPTLHSVPVVIVNPDADENTRYGDAVVLTGYEALESLLPVGKTPHQE